MKFNFKKISAIATSVLMTGMTVGTAMAAGIRPADLGGQGNFAIVYGATANSMDQAQATAIDTALRNQFTSSPVTLDGEGDSFKIEKKNTKFNLENSASTVYPTLDNEELTELLKDLVYKDNDKTEHDVEQTISLGAHEIGLIVDKKYNNEEPTLGITIAKSEKIFDYTLTFTEQPALANMEDSEITILGKNYYIYDADATGITLLDSSSTQTISEGEKDKKVVVGGKEYIVSVEVYDGSKVRFTVNGESTDSLVQTESEKLDDGSYLVVKNVFYTSKESGVSSVDFSIGKGEIYLPKDGEVKVNDEKVDGLKSLYSLDGGTDLESLTLKWTATAKTYLTGAKGYEKMTFPVFEGADYVFTGMTSSSEYEEFEIVPGEEYLTFKTEIQYGDLELPVLYLNATKDGISGNGEDSTTLLKIGVNGSQKETFSIDLDSNETTQVENYFVVSYINGDEGYTYAYNVEDIDDEDGVLLKGMTEESEIVLKTGKTIDRGDLTFEVKALNETLGTATIEVTTSGNGDVYSDLVVSKSGLIAKIPAANETKIVFYEENSDGDLYTAGTDFEVSFGIESDEGIHVSDIGSTGIFGNKKETSEDKVYLAYVDSDIATPMELDESDDLHTFVVKYSGEETYGNLYVAQAGATTSSTGSAGNMIFRDTEASSYAGKNLVIVGGSCVNAAAAKALGVPSDRGVPGCYADSGLSENQFLISKKTIDGGKFAIIVAGYEADQTKSAADYLINRGFAEGVYSSITSETIA